jgi:hypothetical protein
MIMSRLSKFRRSLYGPEGCRGLVIEGSGMMAQTWLAVWSRRSHLFAEKGTAGPHPTSRGARQRTKRRLARRRQIREPKRRKRLAASRSCRRTLARGDPSEG